MIRLIQQLRARRAQAEFDRGYAWAAGELLSGRKTVEDIELIADNPFNYSSAFDFGVLTTAADWRAR